MAEPVILKIELSILSETFVGMKILSEFFVMVWLMRPGTAVKTQERSFRVVSSDRYWYVKLGGGIPKGPYP